jgi:glycosyltransferase involved in cell wall biosynthesis
VYPGVTARKSLNLLPFGQRFRMADRVNGLLGRLVVSASARRLPAPRVVWLYDPRAAWAIGAGGTALAVYDCVDDYAQQVGHVRGRDLVADADTRAAARSDLVFATTRALRERHLRSNPNTHHVGNVGDFEHFRAAADPTTTREDLTALPRPVLGFAGNFLSGKVDPTVVETLADAYPTGTLLLAGPADERLAGALASLATRANVRWLGQIAYDELPSVVAAFDVGLIPYETNAYTRNVFPLKLYEYLAAGKPVVATGLPELSGMEPDVVVVDGADELTVAVDAALAASASEDVERRQALARENTWETRTSRLLELTASHLASSAAQPGSA